MLIFKSAVYHTVIECHELEGTHKEYIQEPTRNIPVFKNTGKGVVHHIFIIQIQTVEKWIFREIYPTY